MQYSKHNMYFLGGVSKSIFPFCSFSNICSLYTVYYNNALLLSLYSEG